MDNEHEKMFFVTKNNSFPLSQMDKSEYDNF